MNIIKKVTFTILLIFIGFGFYKLGKLYSPGSYPNAEEYNINASEEKVINCINEFKNKKPKYIPPEIFNLQDGRYDVKSHWYDAYFYYSDSKEVIHIWTRPSGYGSTKLGFVGVNKGNKLGNWKEINRDFSSSENSRQKDTFKNLILDPIKRLVDSQNN